MAQAESSKVGEEAERLDVMPTRQFLSRATGEPMAVASKMAVEADGAGRLADLAWL